MKNGIDEDILEGYIEKTYTFSSQDKLDWDNEIQNLMKLAIYARGTMHHHKWVKRLESSVETDFSGVNLRMPIQKNREKLEELYKQKEEEEVKKCSDGIYYHPKTINELTNKDRDTIKTRLYHWYWEQRFAFIRDLFAHHRGLIWGKKTVPGGKQMRD